LGGELPGKHTGGLGQLELVFEDLGAAEQKLKDSLTFANRALEHDSSPNTTVLIANDLTGLAMIYLYTGRDSESKRAVCQFSTPREGCKALSCKKRRVLYGEADSKIFDPVIIQSCGLLNRVLLTGDQDLLRTWNNEIIQHRIAVFVTTDNREGPDQWGPRIIAAKDDILRELQRRPKPFTANISKEGRVTQVRVHDGKNWQTIAIRKKNPSNYERKKRKR
jgi:hypothetical protein